MGLDNFPTASAPNSRKRPFSKSSSARFRHRLSSTPKKNVYGVSTTDFERQTELTTVLHLDIESFHVFANILLDRVASSVRWILVPRCGRGRAAASSGAR